jgi:hypothetical protein
VRGRPVAGFRVVRKMATDSSISPVQRPGSLDNRIARRATASLPPSRGLTAEGYTQQGVSGVRVHIAGSSVEWPGCSVVDGG